MWQKKSTESEASEQPALALRPAGARPAQEVSPYGSFHMEEHKETIVSRRPRSHRFMWFLGIVLLVGTALGAAWALNHGSTEQSAGPVEAPAAPPGIVALGMVDNDPKSRNLHPPGPGKGVGVGPEGKPLKKGERILRLDSQFAASLVEGAEAALDNARLQLKLAELLPEKHKIDIQSQEKAIAIAKGNKDAFFAEVAFARDMFKDGFTKKRVLDAAEAKFKTLEDMVEVEKNKLRSLQLHEPKLEVARAKSEVAAKEAQRKKAKLALENCDLLAEENGTVLRVLVNPGEWISPDAKIPVVQFCPTGKRIIRAEVLQEWATLVERGQKVIIEDDTRAGPKWDGTVYHVSDWITQKRDIMLEPFMVNDVRTLECLIDVAPGGPPLRIGQRVRVTILQGK